MKTNIDYQLDNVSAHCTASVDSRRNRRMGIRNIGGGFIKRVGFFLAVVFCIALMSTATKAQVPILYYDFENNATRTTFENAVEQAVNIGSGILAKTGGGTIGGVTGAGTFNGGAASGQAISTNTWQNSTTDPSTAATHYYQFVVNTTGFSQISVTFDDQASATGPARVGILYSTDGTTFFASPTTPILTGNAAFATALFDLSSITAVDNQTSITIRIYGYAGSAADRTGRSTFASTGTFRIDNLTVRAKTVTATKTLLDYPAIGLSIKSGTAFTPTYTDFAVNGAGINVTLAGDLNLGGTLTLTDGTVTTLTSILTIGSAGTISRTSGYVIGNLKKITVPSPFTFHVGTANGYSPVTLSSVTGTGDFTVSATQSAMPGLALPAKSLQRYWTLTNGSPAITSAILTFKYLDADVSGTEANYRIIKDTNGGGAPFTFPDDGADDVDEANNTATTINTITSFSRWSLAEPDAPTAVKLRSFTANSYAGGVVLEWQSGYEVDNLGYNLYRIDGRQRTRVTPSLVAGSALVTGPGTTMTAGQSYSWFDPQGTIGSQYWLEDINLKGRSTMHGPVAPVRSKGVNRFTAQSRSPLLSQLTASPRARTAVTTTQREWPASSVPAIVEQSYDGIRYDDGSGFDIESDPIATQRALAAKPTVKITVNHNGWYRVTQEELIAAGLDQQANASFLQLYADGVEVPIRVNSNSKDGSLEAGDAIEFYGIGVDTLSTDRHVYWLTVGTTQGKRIPGGAQKTGREIDEQMGEIFDGGETDSPATSSGSFPLTVERRERLVYFSSLKNGDGDNIFGQVLGSTPVNEPLTLRHVDTNSTGQAQVEVALQGLTAVGHQVSVQLNGVSIGTIGFTGQEHPTMQFDVPATALQEGTNTVTLTSTGGSSDYSLVDYIRLTYAHTYQADNNSLSFIVQGHRAVSIGGFTNPNVRVIAITDQQDIRELDVRAEQQGSSYSVTVAATSDQTLLAFTDEQAGHPVAIAANTPSAWYLDQQGADFIIVTHRDFRQQVEPLAELRRSQGMKVAVVDVEDIYDEFSYGEHSPQAVKDFLQWTTTHWPQAPHFVLLMGDSTWDPRNYLGQGEADFVPTKLIDTSYMETASDDGLADFDGDGVAEMAVGRLPVRTAAQAATLVSKIVAYDSAPSDPQRGAMMVADTGFEASSSAISALLPTGMPVQPINRSSGDDATVRNQILTGINGGPMIINYIGHGSVGVWTGAGLLTSEDGAGLTNGNRLPIFVLMTCLNGYSHDAYIDSLGEALLKAENGGAVAVWASSGFTSSGPQFQMNQQLYQSLFGTQGITLGDAIRASKAATLDTDVRRTWTLLGDPTMKLR